MGGFKSHSNKKEDPLLRRESSFLVGVAGLEPAASWSRTKHATKLRYTPKTHITPYYYNRILVISQEKFDGFRIRNSVKLSYSSFSRGLVKNLFLL